MARGERGARALRAARDIGLLLFTGKTCKGRPSTRAYIQLRRAEMAFREGERLLSVYGQDPSMTSEKLVTRPANILENAAASFQAAASLYQSAPGQTQDASQQVHARANHARAWVQLFLIEAFCSPNPRSHPA